MDGLTVSSEDSDNDFSGDQDKCAFAIFLYADFWHDKKYTSI